MRKIFTDKLPHKYGIGANKDKLLIDWKSSIGYKVKFIYDNIQGEVEIIDYEPKEQYLFVIDKNEEFFKIKTSNFQNCKLGKLLGKTTNKFKIKIGDVFKNDRRDLIIINKEYRKRIMKNNYIKFEKWYKYHCNKCGYEEGWFTETQLLINNTGCACCCRNPRIVVSGINDIPTTDPWMIKYFQGGYNEAKLYTKSSGQKIYPICPDCGNIKDKLTKISNIYNNHSMGCSNCGDGKSYFEKFMFNVLNQLEIIFETEFNPKWCKFKFKNKIRQGRYDFYFELNGRKYIVEMDGKFHKYDNTLSGQTKEESKQIDLYKDLKAKENNIEVIRIDCKKSELEYIRNNILNSKLNELFDLSQINWLKCEEYALSNLVKKACELKRNNLDMTTGDIGKVMNLNTNTITRYLKKGNKLNWCKYNPKEEMRKNIINCNKNKCKKVEIFKEGISLGVFESCHELERQSKEKFGVNLISNGISLVCLGKQIKHKGFTFKYIK